MARRRRTTSGPTVVAALAEIDARAPETLATVLDDLGRAGVSAAQGNAPRSRTSTYVDSLTHEVEGARVTIGARAPHAHLVERGRRPGRQPPSTLIAHLLDLTPQEGYLVARSIARKGTAGHAVMARTAADLEPEVASAAADLARALGELQP